MRKSLVILACILFVAVTASFAGRYRWGGNYGHQIPGNIHKPPHVYNCPPGWRKVIDRTGDRNAFHVESYWIIKCVPNIRVPSSMECPEGTSFYRKPGTYEIGCMTPVQ